MSTAEMVDFRRIELADLSPQDAMTEIVRRAVDLAASDLFLLSEENTLKVGVRNMGRFEQISVVSKEQGRHLLNYLKSSAGIDIADRRR